MRVFLAGATGAIGRPLVPKLIAAGHEVSALTRAEERAGPLREAGAEPVVADVFDAERMREAMTEARPDVVVHQLTALPERMNFRDKDIYKPTNRLRTEGTRALLEGARAAGSRRFVCQSIAFAYARDGERVKTEDAPLTDEAGIFGEVASALAEMEGLVTGTEGIEGVVLRYGFFYGPGTFYATGGSIADEVRKRRFPVVGAGAGITSFVHVEDAADATVLALDRGSGIYNIVDDEPAQMKEWLPVYAEALGAKKPMRVPRVVASLAAGKEAGALATELPGASNAKAKQELGWKPAHRSWREGFREELAG